MNGNSHTSALRRFVAFALVGVTLASVFAVGVTVSGSKEGVRPSVESSTDHVKYTITEDVSPASGERPQNISFSVSFEEPQLKVDNGYDMIEISGCGSFASSPGAPTVPKKTVTILLPPKGDVSSIRVTPAGSRPIERDVYLYPGQSPVPISDESEPEFTPPDPEFYGSSNPYPNELQEVQPGVKSMLPKLYQLDFVTSYRGYQIAVLTLYPVTYTPAERKVMFYPQLNVEVEPGEASDTLAFRPTPDATEWVKNNVVNPELMSAYESSSESATSSTQTMSLNGAGGDDAEYLIITRPMFLDALKPLIDLKSQRMSVKVITDGGYVTTRIYPSDDAFVDSQDTPDKNYGSETWIAINHAGSDMPESTWLKFDLSSIPSSATIWSATFKAYAYQIWWGDKRSAALWDVSTNDWSESTITANNAPWSNRSLGKISVFDIAGSVPGWWEWDVRIWVDSYKGTIRSAWLSNDLSVGQGHYGQYYYSKEYGDLAYRPYLEVTYRTVPVYTGRDLQEGIRNCIIDYYTNHGTKWVLLVGDAGPAGINTGPSNPGLDGDWELPIRYVKSYDGVIPTDYYYAGLDGTWDTNNNNVFGECNIYGNDEADWFADVYVGRFPVRDVISLQNIVQKTVAYELEPPHEIRACLFSAATSFLLGDCENMKKYIKDNYIDPSGAESYEYYQSDGAISDFTNFTFVNAVNDHDPTLINAAGHGYTNSINLEPGFSAYISDDAVSSLNEDRRFLMYAMACQTNWFDGASNCLGEAMLLDRSDSGAIGYVGGMRDLFGDFGALDMDNKFFEEIFLNGESRQGATRYLSNLNYILSGIYMGDMAIRQNLFITMLLGDPELKIIKGVEVSISPDDQSGSPGSMLTYTVTVTNTSGVADTYSLTASNNASWSWTISPTQLTVPAGESRTATLSVTIPESAEYGTKDMITIIARSQVYPGVCDGDSCTAYTPPPAPQLISPLDGANLNDDTPLLQWGTVSDPNTPILYQVQVDDSSSFTPPVDRDSGWISVNQWEVTPALSDGTWYWRVRAKDSVGSIGGWSSTWSFEVNTAIGAIEIRTVEDLQAMKNDLAGNYVLVNDIDASDTVNWNNDAGFEPIGVDYFTPFTGSFDGQGHKITNLCINRPTTDYVGLFGCVRNEGVVKNVGMESVSVLSSGAVGGLIGWNLGTVSNCYSTGSVSGNSCVGGLFGGNAVGTVSKCYSTATVSCTGDRVGGLVGQNYQGGTVSNCYSTGPVSGNTKVGGLVGRNFDATVSNSYSTGSVSGSGSYVGGLIGRNDYGGVVLNSFWDNRTSGQSTSADGTGKTTDNMKNVRTFTDDTWSVGLTTPWDFVGHPYHDTGNEDIWTINSAINNGYPIFTWATYLDRTPPTPFDLLLPTDGSSVQTKHPTLRWQASSDSDSGLGEYYVYVDDSLRVTIPQPTRSWTLDRDLAEGSHTWYVVARDHAGNTRQSISTFTFNVDTIPPSIPSLLSPPNGAAINDSTPTFEWSPATDPSGVTYTLQYSTDPSFPTKSDAAWLDPDWQYRKKITIDHTKVGDSDLTDFPVAVILDSSNFDFSEARSDGYDIRFTFSDGISPLDYEREEHDSTSQEAVYWVRIPYVSSSTDTEFYIYYGNAAAPNGANPTNVWDIDFKMVQHMNDKTASTIEDTTGNTYDGTKTAANEPIEVSGKIANAQDFDGTDDKIAITGNPIGVNYTDPFTIEFWINPDSITTLQGVYEKYQGIAPYGRYGWLVGITTTGKVWFLSNKSQISDTNIYSDSALTAGSWVHITATQDTSRNMKLYIDGVEQADTGIGQDGTANPFGTRMGYIETSNTYYFDGKMDEVRASDIDRTSAWIKASYNSGNNTLVSYGIEEVQQDKTKTITGLTKSTYTVPDYEALPNDTYYWRVQAVDGVNNPSDWSAAWQFTIILAFSGEGNGTSEDPYVITTVDQLQEMKNLLDDYFILGNDIDASVTSEWNWDGARYLGFEPIGNNDAPFTGSFDGRESKIINLYINRPSTNYVGLLGYVGYPSVVKNVGLEDANVSGSSEVGGLVGGNSRGGISNSYSTGYVSGSNYVGGLIGRNLGTVSNCYSTSFADGEEDVGGLIGNNSGTVTNSYSTGSVRGRNAIGGLIGHNNLGGLVSNCYSTGSVGGGDYVGGLVGYNFEATVTNSFWDIETSEQTWSDGETGKLTAEMKDVRTYTDTTWSEGLDTPWDFVENPYDDVGNEDIWDINPAINDGYPFFNPRSPPADTTPPTSSVDPSELYFSGGYETELHVTIHEDQSRSGLTYRIYYRYWTIGYPFYIDEDSRPVYVDSDNRIYYLDSLDFPENYYPPMIDCTLWCDNYNVDWYDGYGVAIVQFYPVWGSGYYQFRSIAIDGAGNADWQSFGSIPPHDNFSGLYNDYAHRINLRVDEQDLDSSSTYVEYSYEVSCDAPVGIEEGQVKLQGLSSETGQWETLYLKPPPILEGVVAAELPPNEYSRVGLYIYAELEAGNGLFTVMWNRTIT